jgi:hypothetical protein
MNSNCRWWAPHDGIIPGSHLELPYIAPFDHLMDLEACGQLCFRSAQRASMP